MLICFGSHCKCSTPEVRHQSWYLNVETKIPQSFTHAKLLQPSVISVGAVAAQHFENLTVWSEVLSEGDRCLTALIALECSLELDGSKGDAMPLTFAVLLSRQKPTDCSPLCPWLSESRAWHLLFGNFLLPPFCLRHWAEFAKMLPATSESSCWGLQSGMWYIISFVGQNFDRLSWSLDPWKSFTICHDYKKDNTCSKTETFPWFISMAENLKFPSIKNGIVSECCMH